MHTLLRTPVLTALLCLILLVLAFVAAPYSCTWGLSAYSGTGLLVLGTLFTLPLLRHRDTPLPLRLLHSLGLAVAGLGCWAIGLFMANFQLLCRLF
jgi:hypothetical protein